MAHSTERRLVGVDEAGKGPALGSMFAAAVAVPDPDVLPEDVDDSKEVAPERRRELAAALGRNERVAVGISEVPPARIDDPGTDMNSLTVRAHAEAIAALDCLPSSSGVGRWRVVLDAGDVDADRFARRVGDRVGIDLDLHAEHGADESHPVVGGASVVAKVERDAHVERIARQYGDVGSGYPSDPTTREFLSEYVAEHGDLPPFARESWQTCRDVVAAVEQSDFANFYTDRDK